MIFNMTFYIAAGTCLLGISWRIYEWFKRHIGPDTVRYKASERLGAAVRSAVRVLFSSRMIKIVKVLVWDPVMQIPLLKAGFFRWLSHMFLFYGFLLLVMMHALDKVITVTLFPDYASTLNPFLFLRNLFGGLVIIGILMTIIGRIHRNRRFKATNVKDRVAIFLLGVILLSGFLLEAVQIFSSSIFDEMVADYMGTDDPEAIESLKS
jgi:nitrate reductase gamma subunit